MNYQLSFMDDMGVKVVSSSNYIANGATLSECKKYRYKLHRLWDADKPYLLFIMLNPSTASAIEDDPTIRRCVNFAKALGYGGIFVGNLFAYRATQPNDLKKVSDPIGEHNLDSLQEMSNVCKHAVCAWGNRDILKYFDVDKKFIETVKIPLMALSFSKDGIPKHPLYLKSDTTLKPYKFNSTPWQRKKRG